MQLAVRVDGLPDGLVSSRTYGHLVRRMRQTLAAVEALHATVDDVLVITNMGECPADKRIRATIVGLPDFGEDTVGMTLFVNMLVLSLLGNYVVREARDDYEVLEVSDEAGLQPLQWVRPELATLEQLDEFSALCCWMGPQLRVLARRAMSGADILLWVDVESHMANMLLYTDMRMRELADPVMGAVVAEYQRSAAAAATSQ